jgi:hypothetical protein
MTAFEATTPEVYDDPFADHLRRDPLPDAGIRVILLTDLPAESADAIISPLADLIEGLGRPVERFIVPVGSDGLGRSLERGLRGATLPLVLVTTAEEPWTKAHLEPLLEAINQCDHVVGGRRDRTRTNWSGLPGLLIRRLIFAVPLRDVHSPGRLHRLDKLAAIPLQSSSSFVDTEILAKATFLGQLIDEVAIPPLRGRTRATGLWMDVNQVLGHPVFARSSCPPEEPQCQCESDDGPGGDDQHGRADIHQTRPLEQHPAQGADQLRERQSLNERLGGGGKTLGREENAGEEPHRQHDHVHEAADGFRGTGAAGDQQSDSGERERAQQVDSDHESQAAAHRHMEHQRSQEEQNSQVRDHEREPSAQEGEQEIAPGHRRGDEPLEQFGNAKIDEQKADAPEAAPHGVQPDQAGDQEINVA